MLKSTLQMLFHGARRDTHAPGHLGLRQVGEVTKGDGFALAWWKPGQGFVERDPARHAVGVVARRICRNAWWDPSGGIDGLTPRTAVLLERMLRPFSGLTQAIGFVLRDRFGPAVSIAGGEMTGFLRLGEQDIFSPVTGRIVARNAALAETPELINRDPYGEGWMVIVQMMGKELKT
jgi:hypothetical protein